MYPVDGAGFMVQGVWCRVYGEGCMVQGIWCRVQGAGCRVQGQGCRMQLLVCVAVRWSGDHARIIHLSHRIY